jgi:hypothetical protein
MLIDLFTKDVVLSPLLPSIRTLQEVLSLQFSQADGQTELPQRLHLLRRQAGRQAATNSLHFGPLLLLLRGRSISQSAIKSTATNVLKWKRINLHRIEFFVQEEECLTGPAELKGRKNDRASPQLRLWRGLLTIFRSPSSCAHGSPQHDLRVRDGPDPERKKQQGKERGGDEGL